MASPKQSALILISVLVCISCRESRPQADVNSIELKQVDGTYEFTLTLRMSTDAKLVHLQDCKSSLGKTDCGGWIMPRDTLISKLSALKNPKSKTKFEGAVEDAIKSDKVTTLKPEAAVPHWDPIYFDIADIIRTDGDSFRTDNSDPKIKEALRKLQLVQDAIRGKAGLESTEPAIKHALDFAGTGGETSADAAAQVVEQLKSAQAKVLTLQEFEKLQFPKDLSDSITLLQNYAEVRKKFK